MPWRRSGYKHDLAGVLVLQDPAGGCGCFGEGVGPVDERFDPALIPEHENGLEFFAEDRDLPHRWPMLTPLTVRLWFISPSGVSSGMPGTWETRRPGRRRCPPARVAKPSGT